LLPVSWKSNGGGAANGAFWRGENIGVRRNNLGR